MQSIEDKAEIVVWPEVSVPSYLATNVNDRLFFHNRIMDNNAFLILGIPESRFINGKRFSYNSAMIMFPDGNFDIYQKIAL